MVNGKGAAKPYISFIGNSSTDVTGSMHLIRFKKYVTLLDCGLIQLSDPMSSYKANREQLKKVKPNEIDYIILTHIHTDHGGMIPALYAKGCHAHVYVPTGSIPFLRLLWLDSMKIMRSDAIRLQSKHGYKATPFYDEQAIDRALARCIEVNMGKPWQMNEDMTFTYYSAGHIIDSAQVYLELREGSIIKRIGYTGDIGSGSDGIFVTMRQTLQFCDVLIGENTYNVPSRLNSKKDRPKDIEKIRSITDEYNKVLIPTFSLQRTQQLMIVLYSCGVMDKMPVYLDSPLASKICGVWDDPNGDLECAMKNVKIIETWEQSVALQNSKEHCVIISASGFLSGGRIMAHLKTALPNTNDHIIFIGYSGDNNLASQIKSGQKEVMVDGTVVKNNANFTELRSFSSHANHEELTRYYVDECRFNKLALVHGDYQNKVGFAKHLQDQLGKAAKSSKVVCVNQDQRLYV